MWFLAVIILTVPAFMFLLRPGIHNMQDNMQYFRIYEMDKCFADKQIPCRWVPDLGYGFGYPLYLYYAPGPYYLGSLIHAIGFQYIDSVKILFILGFVFSAIGMYLLLLTLFSNKTAAFMGSLLYIYAPVRAVEVYVRGSLSEFLAMAIFPILFLFSYRIIKKIGRFNILGFGLALFCQLITHNLMSVAILPILSIWIITLLIQEKRREALKDIVKGLLIGFGLASFYILPLIFERRYVHLESLIGGYFDYRQHFVNLFQLFISNKWGYGSSQLGSGDDLSLSVGQIQLVLAMIAIFLAVKKYKNEQKRSILVLVLGGLSLLTIFLIHQRSAFIWDTFKFMAMFQFPWRFLVISAFLLSILSAYAINGLALKKQIFVVVGIMILVFVLFGGFFRPQKWFNISDQHLLSGAEFEKQQTVSIFDYLPKNAVLPPNYKAPDMPEIILGDAVITNYVKGTNWQRGIIKVVSLSATIRVPIFDFPGMEVVDNGKVVGHNHLDCSNQDYCFGQISFNLEKGVHNVEIKLKNTTPRGVGDVFSLISLTTILIILVGKKEWLE